MLTGSNSAGGFLIYSLNLTSPIQKPFKRVGRLGVNTHMHSLQKAGLIDLLVIILQKKKMLLLAMGTLQSLQNSFSESERFISVNIWWLLKESAHEIIIK